MQNILFFGGIAVMAAAAAAGAAAAVLFRIRTRRLERVLDNTYGKALREIEEK